MRTFVIGGARSGKSSLAAKWAAERSQNVCCLWPAAAADPQADLRGWHAERDAFLESLRAAPGEIIIVSNEVGTSLVPENAAARLFRDEQGRLNQLVAAECDSVFLVTAGLALRLK
jgi:adenosylcobinamide kinase/adenosylcobinamide-phosphate guanylyltransferase